MKNFGRKNFQNLERFLFLFTKTSDRSAGAATYSNNLSFRHPLYSLSRPGSVFFFLGQGILMSLLLSDILQILSKE